MRSGRGAHHPAQGSGRHSLAWAANLAIDPEASDLPQLDRAGLEWALQNLRSSSTSLNRQLERLATSQQQSETGERALQQQLTTSRGQAEQRCASLGSNDPAAELEQRQAQALTLLQSRFHEAQSRLANRYSEPLREAIGPYLATLTTTPLQPLLAFDPQQGFQDLQLRQGSEAYDFDRLSGGMCEQLAAGRRPALAEVLHPAYASGLPLVFDDAFTNSDRERLVGLKHMLRRGMEQGIQILLLSCQPQDYRDLDAAGSQQKAPGERINGGEQQRNLPDDVMWVQLS